MRQLVKSEPRGYTLRDWLKSLNRGSALEDPSDLHPALTSERLQKLGELILRTRHLALQDHYPQKGDNAWSYGCKCYARCKYRIKRWAGRKGYEWLSVIDDGREFIVGIGGVPLKFYKGEPDDPPVRAFVRRPRELDALQLEFDNMTAAPQEVLRLIVCTGSDLRVHSIWLLQLSVDGEIRNRYEVPVQSNDVHAFDQPNDAVELPKPTVRPRHDEADLEDEQHQAG